MILYITVLVVTVMLASKIKYVELSGANEPKTRQYVVNHIMLAAIFAVLFLLSALRIRTGNDYLTYIEHFHDVYCGNYVVTELGFNAIVNGVYWLFDSEAYLIIFAIFALGTVFFSLKSMYEGSKDFVLTFYLYMALSLYFQSLNTVRYYFALSLVMLAMLYVVKKEYVSFIITVLVASLFHKSVLVVIPLYLLAKVNWKKWQLGLFGVFAITGLVFSNQYLALMLKLYPSYVNEEEYLLQGSSSIINIARCVLVIAFALMFYKDSIKDNEENRFYLYLNVGALALYTCFTFVPFVSRIGYYLNVSQIFLIPGILAGISDEKKKRFFRLIIIIAAMIYFAFFLYKASADTIKILPYTSWVYSDIK